MRDENRIPGVLAAVEAIWREYPDWRLGQLLSNLAHSLDRDVFQIEDDQLQRIAQKRLEEGW